MLNKKITTLMLPILIIMSACGSGSSNSSVENSSNSDNINSGETTGSSGTIIATDILSVTTKIDTGKLYRYSRSADIFLPLKVLSVNNSVTKNCYFNIEKSRFNFTEGAEIMARYDDVFSIRPSYSTGSPYAPVSEGRFKLDSSPYEDVSFMLNFSTYARQDSFVEFKIDCQI